MKKPFTPDQLRSFTVARNFPHPDSLQNVFNQVHFIQADPIRSPARAQDLILRHRVHTYHAGDLERLYTSIDVEEDFFINYGYVSHYLHKLMHPRANSRAPFEDPTKSWPIAQRRKVKLILEFVRAKGLVHPRELDQHFSHGRVTNYWGGSSNASTHLMEEMHYQGMLRVVRREKGIRIYAARDSDGSGVRPTKKEVQSSVDKLVDVLVNIYAPFTASSLSYYIRRLRYATPQWKSELPDAVKRAKLRLSHAKVNDVDWYWPTGVDPNEVSPSESVRFLAPFDPVVHDRSRFEILWGWVYRFEAYTPAPKRKLGYYALPLLWKDKVIGWANLSIKNGTLDVDLGFAESNAVKQQRVFKRELDMELDRMKSFLKVS